MNRCREEWSAACPEHVEHVYEALISSALRYNNTIAEARKLGLSSLAQRLERYQLAAHGAALALGWKGWPDSDDA